MAQERSLLSFRVAVKSFLQTRNALLGMVVFRLAAKDGRFLCVFVQTSGRRERLFLKSSHVRLWGLPVLDVGQDGPVERYA